MISKDRISKKYNYKDDKKHAGYNKSFKYRYVKYIFKGPLVTNFRFIVKTICQR